MGPAVVGCHRQFPARTLLCGGADVLACTIRFSPEIEATRNGWCAWARCGRGCHGRNPCGLGSIKPAGRGVRAQRCGHLVLFRTKSRPRPRCGSPVLDMSRNKRGYLHGSPTTAPAAFKEAAYHGGLCCVRACAACVLVYMQALAARPT